MKLPILILGFVLGVAHASSLEEQWGQFKLSYGKTYKSLLEEKRRFAIFTENVKQIEEHNERFARNEETYAMGINKFTDKSNEELAATLTPLPSVPRDGSIPMFDSTGVVANKTVDWVKAGLVTPVKDQKNCGGCWAFSTVGAVEGVVARNGKGLVSLSPQNLIDCSRNGGNTGCHGGNMINAYVYIKMKGIFTEEEYPYVGKDGSCQKRGGLKISGYVGVANNETEMLSALSVVGPLAVSIDASDLFKYASGILQARCSHPCNHAVLLVGAGTENGLDYWLVKNSWGADWGEKGYFKLQRGVNALCVTRDITFPKL